MTSVAGVTCTSKPAMPASGSTLSAAPRRMASRGMPKTTQVASSWQMFQLPASRILRIAAAPSSATMTVSRAVSAPNSLAFWNARPTPRREMRSEGRPAMSRPSSCTVPEVGGR